MLSLRHTRCFDYAAAFAAVDAIDIRRFRYAARQAFAATFSPQRRARHGNITRHIADYAITPCFFSLRYAAAAAMIDAAAAAAIHYALPLMMLTPPL